MGDRELKQIYNSLLNINSTLDEISSVLNLLSSLMVNNDLSINTDTSLLSGYTLTGEDTIASIEYYGYLKENGDWIIKEVDKSIASTIITKFIKGDSSYSTNWTNRASLTYNYIDNI